jgi:hypothetical protein
MNLQRDISFMFEATSVRIGTIWVQARDVGATLARYAHQVFCLPEPVDYYALRGTASALRYKDNCAIFVCRHQYRDFPADRVMIAEDEAGKNLISGSTLITVTPEPHTKDEEILDVSAMRYIPDNYSKPNLGSRFFNVLEADLWKGNADANFFCYGYPFEHVKIKIDEEDGKLQAIDVRKVLTSAKYNGKSAAQNTHRIEMTRLGAWDSNGMSGGPVFHISQDNQGFFAGLAGIILRGSPSSDFLHIVDANFLLKVLVQMASPD